MCIRDSPLNIAIRKMSSATSRCTICLDPVDHPIARLNPCLHIFCFTCVKGWIPEKLTCPNCTVKCTSVIRVEKGGETELKLEDIASLSIGQPSEAKENTEKVVKKESFDCIDHTFIISEVKKLLGRTSCIRKRLSTYSGRHARYSHDYLRCIQNICDTLNDLKYDMEEFAEFEPEDMMMMLYEIDADLTVIDKNGDPDQLYYGYHEEEDCEDFEIAFEPEQSLFEKIAHKPAKSSSKKK
eukprot:TRINITY_DN0_c2609_g1_i1.p1 TRINITY_DN0_c2609_g1~~TRINITY_DN0_c2609_g1_i1.p1  ORF type:complete len:240 (-),score=41.47 TRINITY_DN0_c2609_g1_i1:99-818(-)